jgi:hypothetical protein
MRNKKQKINELETYILPSDNDEMRKFISKFKVDMMENVVSSIKFAVEHKLPLVEVFQFKGTPFVVTINEHEFIPNLSHIHKFYLDNEMYELCQRVEVLCETLKKNEKENQKPTGPSSTT